MKSERTNRTIDKYSKLLQSDIKSNASKNSNTGALANSIKVSSEGSGKFNFKVILEMEDYGDYVDEGRKPGKGVPVEQLKKWVKSRNMILQDANGKNVRMTESRINGLTYVINRKIKEEGIKPTYFITETLNELENKFIEEMGDSITDDLFEELFGEDETTQIKI